MQIKTFLQFINEQTSKTATVCQQITPSSDILDLQQIVEVWKKSYPTTDIYPLLNRLMARHSAAYQAQGIPQKISCELALLRIRPAYKDKNAFIIDTLNKLIYLYDNRGKFIAKTEVISGKNRQSTDPVKTAAALLTWSKVTQSLGFQWIKGKGYVDSTGKGRTYSSRVVYDEMNKKGIRFLPKGVYTTGKITSDAEYAGAKNNLLFLFSGDQQMLQAIHGYYPEQSRKEALLKAEKVLSQPDDPSVGKEFIDLIKSGKVDLSQSYGCLNVPKNFLKYINQYGQNAYVFNIGEGEKNYLVNNTIDYFNKMSATTCPSPQSLGAIPTTGIV